MKTPAWLAILLTRRMLICVFTGFSSGLPLFLLFPLTTPLTQAASELGGAVWGVAAAIVLIELSAKMIADQMPAAREVMDIVARRYNEKTLYRWGRIIDFLKLHYVLSQRRDTAFWRDNMDPASIPERLQELMALWQYQGPYMHEEFDRVDEVFPSASYQYVLYGMGFRTEVSARTLEPEVREARRARAENADVTARMLSGLPRHRDLIDRIVKYGLQPV